MYEQPVGKASYELNVPMRANMSFPIGSNTKLFTGIAVWQLHKQGKLSVYDPVSKYVKPSDFGLNGTWCPRLTNVTSGEQQDESSVVWFCAPGRSQAMGGAAAASGPCEVPLVHHLLSMGSGLYDILNCAYLPNSPQLQFCTGTVGSPWETKFTIAQYSNMLVSPGCSGGCCGCCSIPPHMLQLHVYGALCQQHQGHKRAAATMAPPTSIQEISHMYPHAGGCHEQQGCVEAAACV